MITIVILLILAGISISALTNTGILKNAKEAKKKSEEATKKEQSLKYGYGDAILEISSSGTGTTSWRADYSYFPGTDSSFFLRGG